MEIQSTSPSNAVADRPHQTQSKPTQRIRLLRKPNGERKGYLYACVDGTDRFQVGFSLCHDDKFDGEKGIEIAKKRAKRNASMKGWTLSKYFEGRIVMRSYIYRDKVLVPESIVNQLEFFIDYCKGVFELKPPEWADGFGVATEM